LVTEPIGWGSKSIESVQVNGLNKAAGHAASIHVLRGGALGQSEKFTNAPALDSAVKVTLK
jgi:hypothetical protein